MRIVFCDDDSVILEQLQNYVHKFFENIGGIQPEYAVYETGVAVGVDAAIHAAQADRLFLGSGLIGGNDNCSGTINIAPFLRFHFYCSKSFSEV